MQIGLNNLGLTGASNRFSPASLFSAGEQGVWYEAYDPNTVTTRRNWFTYSEQFDNAIWLKTGVTVTTNVAISPDGGYTAAKISSSAVGQQRVDQVLGAPWQMACITVYGQASDANWLWLGSAQLANQQVWFNLSTGVVGTAGSLILSSSITSVGSGWYRCQATLALTGNTYVSIGTSSGDNTIAPPAAGLGINIWGAQLDRASTASTYQKVTNWSTEYLNIAPRTNLIDYSETLTNAVWVSGGAPITARGDGSYEVVESTANSPHYFGQFLTTTISNGASLSYVVRAKTAGVTTISLVCGFSSASFNLSTGVASGASGASAMMVDAGDGYYDCILYNIVASSATSVIVYLTSNATFPGSGGSIYVKRMQLNTTVNPVAYQTTPYSTPTPNYVTLWQDTNGTTPVTAVEQPVGLLLDKRIAIGSERVGSPLTGTPGSNSIINGNSIQMTSGLTHGVTEIFLTPTLTVGKIYRVSVVVSDVVGSGVYVRLGSVGATAYQMSSNGTYTFHIAAAGTSGVLFGPWSVATDGATISNISVKLVDGNHASQSTTAARPTLSARYNLLTKTEQFDDAAWTKTGATVTPNTHTGPFATGTADTINFAGGGVANAVLALISPNAPHVVDWYVQMGTVRYVQLLSNGDAQVFVNFDLQSKTVGTAGSKTTGTITDLGGGWLRLRMSHTSVTTSDSRIQAVDAANALYGAFLTTAGTLILGAADLRITNDTLLSQPAYQRVNTSTDYDTNGFPHYLKFDGVDDGLATSSTAALTVTTDKVSVGVAQGDNSTGASFRALVDYGSTVGLGGGFYVANFIAGGTTTSVFVEGGGGSNSRNDFVTSLANTGNAVLSVAIDRALAVQASEITARKNKVNVAPSAGVPGNPTGNFGNQRLSVGYRVVPDLYYLGRIYAVIVRFAQNTASDTSSMETYLGSKAGLTL